MGSSRILLSYITLRGYELESIYEVVKENSTISFADLKKIFSLDADNQSGQLRDSVNFLNSTGIIRISADESEITIAKNFDNLPFRLVLLNQIRLDKANPFGSVLSHLVKNDYFRFNLEYLKKSVEKSLELGFTWTDEKLAFWMDLAIYLGLGRKYHGFILYPSLELLKMILKDFSSRGLTQFNLKNFLNYCSANYFDCFTREKRVFKGLQLSLLLLNKAGGPISIEPAASDDPDAIYLCEKQYGVIISRG